MSKFKTGDKVRVLSTEAARRATDRSASWMPEMDATVGQIGTVAETPPWAVGRTVRVLFPPPIADQWYYHEDSLELVEEPKAFKIGDKVRFLQDGRTGTVELVGALMVRPSNTWEPLICLPQDLELAPAPTPHPCAGLEEGDPVWVRKGPNRPWLLRVFKRLRHEAARTCVIAERTDDPDRYIDWAEGKPFVKGQRP